MKIAIAGKGGVGKTTVAGLLAHAMAARGQEVIAVDCDPTPCLGAALGFPEALLAGMRPIAEMHELVAERTGSTPGGYVRLNPGVEDIPERYSAVHRGIRLLALGAVMQGGAGCICPQSTLLRRLVGHLLLQREQVVLLDLYAGVEHLGRATSDAVDTMLVVVEPTLRSLAAADQIVHLARDIGLDRLYLVANKVQGEDDRRLIEERGPHLPLLGSFPTDAGALLADRSGSPAWDVAPALARAAQTTFDALRRERTLDLPRLR